MTPVDLPPVFVEEFRPVLDRLAGDVPPHYGGADVRLVPVGFEDRPFSRLIRLAVVPRNAAQPIGHVFVKVFKPKDPAAGIDLKARVSKDFAVTRAVFEFLSRDGDAGVVKPLVFYEDLLVIATEQAHGDTLLDRLQRGASLFASRAARTALTHAMEGTGRWLKRFQAFDTTDRRVEPDSLVEYVDVRLRRLTGRGVFTGTERTRILAYLGRLLAQATDRDLQEVSIHADLAPSNVLVDGPRVIVLDFAMASRGTWVHDVSRLFLQVDILRAKPQYRPAIIRDLQLALLRGLDAALSPNDPLFRALLMLHRVNHLGTLALSRERFPARLMSGRVVALHRHWIDGELRSGVDA